MILCPKCGKRFNSMGFHCPACGFEPETIRGYPAFAPESAKYNDGYSADSHKRLFTREQNHFWFQYRNRLIQFFLDRHFPLIRSFCEIGCGTGYVLAGLATKRPDIQYTGTEIYSSALPMAASRVPQARFLQADACNLYFAEEFDVIGSFDVLEHIENDRRAIENIYKAIIPGGGAIITVPQHQWLWSTPDETAHHKRRYSKKI